jgi:O-methyltransferase involved in polyketide biosynthesis
MNLKPIIQSTASVVISYLTYQAVRSIIQQLEETNPPLAIWFRQFSAHDKIQDGDRYLQELMTVNQELAYRVMTVRQHLAEEVLDYLPELCRTGILQANQQHQRQHLEKMMQLSIPEITEDQ